MFSVFNLPAVRKEYTHIPILTNVVNQDIFQAWTKWALPDVFLNFRPIGH